MHSANLVIAALLACSFNVVNALANPPIDTDKVAAGYLLLNPTEGPSKLKALASNAATIPINRIYLSFVRPDMVYVPGSNTLEHADIGYAVDGDYGFGEMKKYVAELQAGGVEVFLSMGGWNYNCYPYFYAKYSIASFGKGPNFWKITQYGGGSASGCNESNMWCYVCEPQSQNTALKDFTIFPEPGNTDTWKAAQSVIESGAKGMPVQWHSEITPGAQFTDPQGGETTTVPGSNYFVTTKRDPYTDFIHLAKDLGLDGVDLDYEEMWHADTFRSGNGTGPFQLDQTVYKYSAIVADMANAIKSIYPTCKLSTAAGAAGAWSTKWWGGNLKGMWYYSNLWYPDLNQFMFKGPNAGGINVMTYDLSKNNNFFECPDTTSNCDLAGQVKFYMNTYASAGIPARVGYEIGQPAYPDAGNDAANQIPLTQAELTGILGGVSSSSTMGGFFWELYKAKNSEPTGAKGQPDNIDATSVAQQVCAKVLPNESRCKGSIPQVGGLQPGTEGPSASIKSTTSSIVDATVTAKPVPPTIASTSQLVSTKAKTSHREDDDEDSAPKSQTVIAGGGAMQGSPCSVHGQTQCTNGDTYQCAYYGTYTLSWVPSSMNPLAVLLAVATTVAALATPPVGTAVSAGYLLLNPTTGPAKLKALADNAANIPVNRVYLSFVAPTMVYVPGSNTLQYSDIGYSSSGDYGFAEVKKYVAQLQAGGVEVFLSMGGWNYNCYPYLYMKYSIAYFGKGPNYWKITQYGGGSASGCNESNMWCYVCEPQSENTTLKDFIVFPEPENASTWKAVQSTIAAGAKGEAIKWHPEIVGGAQFTDPVDKQTVTTVPGSNYFVTVNRDPYTDFVYLAKDLGLDGVDLDYEEMWHADTFRSGSGTGPFKLDQTVYKYTAIALDMVNAIKAIYPECKLSTAAGAAGAWSNNWWGGNLKGLWYYSNLWYPEVTKFMSAGANAGGINVMTYDLSDNNVYFECPDTTSNCDLAGQVKFYMNTYATAGIPARVGYEIGQPAYPDPSNDPTHQVPLTQSGLTDILNGVPNTGSVGGFFWELYKPKNSAPTGPSGQPNNIDATTVAQQMCAKVLPNASRCKGVIPPIDGSSPVTTASQAPTTSSAVPTTSSAVRTTSSTVRTTSAIKSSTTSVKKTTTTKATTAGPATTGSGDLSGTPCTVFGGTVCSSNVLYQCAYYTSSGLTWGKWTTC
ncbi:hypothetical protein HDU81_010705 [Chytriomyces hyalinus]|nr:hypothetical protein HDU81_010705 [Chytriomyces hyalinus]